MSSPGHYETSSYQSAGLGAKPSNGKELCGKESIRNLTNWGAALNMLKFMIGLGIISLPEATAHVGWLPSLIGLAVVALVTVWGIFFAVQSRLKLDGMEQEQRDVHDVRSLSEGAPLVNSPRSGRQEPFDSGCGFFDGVVGKVLGRHAQFLFAACIALGQFTTLVIYVIVIVQNIKSYFAPNYADTLILVSVIILLGMFCLIPTLQGISVLAALGLSIYAFLFIGLFIVLGEKVHSGTLPESTVLMKPLDRSAGQWFGVSCFAFSGFPIAMVIYEEMIDTRSFEKVVIGVFFTCWLAYSVFALLGYLCFGEEVHTLIYFNFEAGSVFRNGSSGALACILCFSFVVQAMPVFNCTARAWEQSGLADKLGVKGGLPMPVLRWTVLAVTIVVAYLVPSVKLMMNTVGVISGVLSGFIFPALTYLVLSSRDEYLARFRCCIVLVIGVLGAYYSCTAGSGPSVT